MEEERSGRGGVCGVTGKIRFDKEISHRLLKWPLSAVLTSTSIKHSCNKNLR